MLINSDLPNRFWVEIIEIANYLRNRLLTKTKTHGEIIPKEA